MSDFEPIHIIRIIEESITKPRNDGKAGSNLYDVPFRLSHNPSEEWIDFVTQAWDTPSNPSLAHRPGICTVSGETIWLAGTTIEEVERFHKDTLMLALADANQKCMALASRQSAEEDIRRKQYEVHDANVHDVAKNMKFE